MNRSAIKVQGRGDELTSGTMKLMAIFLKKRRSDPWGLVKKAFDEVLGVFGWCRRQENGFWAVE